MTHVGHRRPQCTRYGINWAASPIPHCEAASEQGFHSAFMYLTQRKLLSLSFPRPLTEAYTRTLSDKKNVRRTVSFQLLSGTGTMIILSSLGSTKGKTKRTSDRNGKGLSHSFKSLKNTQLASEMGENITVPNIYVHTYTHTYKSFLC
jgi:hypothetical protein